MDLSAISATLDRGPEGIWCPRVAGSGESVSYPEQGNDACFAIEDDSFWFAHRSDCISAALGRFPFSGPFLDVGGGNGAVSQRLAADGIETVLLEPGPLGVVNARKRALPNVVCATIREAAFAASSFVAAGLFDVIEHVEDEAELLADVHHVLRPGGILCVTVPAYTWLWSAEDEDAGHYRRYTIRRLRCVLEASGFTVDYLTYFFAPLVAPLFLGRSLRYRLGRRSDAARSAAQHTPRGVTRHAVAALLAPEARIIRRAGRIPLGTSILAVARARPTD
jgi:SAM-dependent methyltransferase